LARAGQVPSSALNYAAHSFSQAILNSGFQIGHCDLIGRCPTERAHAVGTTTLPAGSHQYYFDFAFSGGTARLPETGAYRYPIVFGHPVYLPRVVSKQ